jgi:hypothetical protein
MYPGEVTQGAPCPPVLCSLIALFMESGCHHAFSPANGGVANALLTLILYSLNLFGTFCKMKPGVEHLASCRTCASELNGRVALIYLTRARYLQTAEC